MSGRQWWRPGHRRHVVPPSPHLQVSTLVVAELTVGLEQLLGLPVAGGGVELVDFVGVELGGVHPHVRRILGILVAHGDRLQEGHVAQLHSSAQERDGQCPPPVHRVIVVDLDQLAIIRAALQHSQVPDGAASISSIERQANGAVIFEDTSPHSSAVPVEMSGYLGSIKGCIRSRLAVEERGDPETDAVTLLERGEVPSSAWVDGESTRRKVERCRSRVGRPRGPQLVHLGRRRRSQQYAGEDSCSEHGAC